ncbi:MAG: TlyA family RNA methyltransferase, partial [Promicromonosporaceae bacterium]|nr:TlyA family RNA methyltransferase [Promicromonosporaceae bacterium]
MIKAGRVRAAGKLVGKPSALLDRTAQDELEISGAPGSPRGAQKLASAIAVLRAAGHQVEIAGKVCLDIGAATGGFTQVLLAEGASQVIALDVGHSQLLPGLRANPQVITLEGVNARYLARTDLPAIPQFITCDVSFISLKMIIPVIARVATPGAQLLLLIKPQFEVGKGNLGKGGV